MIASVRALIVGILLLGPMAHADKKAAPRKPAVVGRVVDLEVRGDSHVVTVLAGSDSGIGKTWRATFVDAATRKPLAGGEAVVIHVDKTSTVLKTRLSAEQVRASRTVQFDPQG